MILVFWLIIWLVLTTDKRSDLTHTLCAVISNISPIFCIFLYISLFWHMYQLLKQFHHLWRFDYFLSGKISRLKLWTNHSNISPGYGTYLNIDDEMVNRAPIVDRKSILKLSWDSLDRVYLEYQCDIFKINNALVYQILLKMITDKDACFYVKHRKNTENGQTMLFHVHKQYLGPDHVARQVVEAEKKL